MLIHRFVLLAAACVLVASFAAAQDAVYRHRNEYPVLDEITAAREARHAVADSLRAAADARHAAEAEAAREARLSLRVDWSSIDVPDGPDAFDAAWHQPPVPQFYTGSCWAFCSVSYLESEVHRRHGREVKLSEMWIVYHEYVEKARRFLDEYGHSVVDEGSQDHGTIEVARRYGLVPADAYPGVSFADGRHDHVDLIAELKAYLAFVEDSGTWDTERNLATVRAILDRHLGAPPVAFTWNGAEHTPLSFRDDVCALDLDDYVSCVSRMDQPFGARVLLDVRDNWRRKADYLNLPLDDWYRVLREAVADGVTVGLGGDNSEPGMDGLHDAAVIPEWDIPARAIGQAAREMRIVNGTTGDDHGVHAVAVKRHKGRDWFLIKDSNRSSRLGTYPGYYMWDGDYIRLKMLSFMVHRDRLGDLLPDETARTPRTTP